MTRYDATIRELRRLGVSDEQIAATIVDGKPLSELAAEEGPAHGPWWPYKSKAEYRYAERLKGAKLLGTIEWWAYEAISLAIVGGEKPCRYTPDFAIYQDGRLRFVEIKGYLREAARIRFLAARERYPFWEFLTLRYVNGDWEDVL